MSMKCNKSLMVIKRIEIEGDVVKDVCGFEFMISM